MTTGAQPTTGLTDLIQGMRVLLAEDNVVNQKVAVNILRRLGCEVEAVENGRLAVEAASHGVYDVILMDVQMPELDGLAATAAIRRLPVPNRSLPIIAVTANAMRGDREVCLGAGMDDFLPKPVTSADLLAMLVKWDARNTEETTAMEFTANTRVYDPEALEDAFGDDAEFVASVLAEYISSAAGTIEAIDAACQTGDATGLERYAHTIKGSSRTVGAMRVAAVSGQLEALGRAGTCEGAADLVVELRDEFQMALEEIQPRISTAA
jgi:CheY-like chemotaxis protein